MLEHDRKMDTSMETSLYPEDGFLLKEKMRGLKRPVTLDLESGGGALAVAKRHKFSGLLSSPDLNLLKLASPELESLIIQHNGQVTTTPTPTQFIFPRNVTEEQEIYAKGFVDALAELHTSNHGDEAAAAGAYTTFAQLLPGGSAPYGEGDAAQAFLPVTIKEEPQTVPNGCSSASPPMSPINMMDQERIKLERKRQRNRVAASKCRRRKLERIARLEDKVRALKNDNAELGTVVTKLKDHVCGLKQQLLEHVNSGCHILGPPNFLS